MKTLLFYKKMMPQAQLPRHHSSIRLIYCLLSEFEEVLGIVVGNVFNHLLNARHLA